jgi:peptidylprolyl isomerase domain and WD repeat-containing protein 1
VPVFGRVTKGQDVVQEIEKVRTDRNDKPLEEIKIISIKINYKDTEESKDTK